MIDPKALDVAFAQVLAAVSALLREGDVVTIDGKPLRGARDKCQSAQTRMMVISHTGSCRSREVRLVRRVCENSPFFGGSWYSFCI